MSLDVLKAEVGDFLGYGRDPDQWDLGDSTGRQAAEVAKCIRRGLRQFYYPEPVDGSAAIYEWTFLKAVFTVTLLDGERSVLLPDDFASLDGPLTITSDDASVRNVVQVVGGGMIRKNFSLAPDATGPPMMAAVEQVTPATTAGRGQRWEIKVYPEADDDYTLQGGYDVVVNDLTTARPYPYGGAQHAETILASCIAAAEQSSLGQQGPQHAYFLRRLAASIGQDRRLKPSVIGRMRDPGSGLSRWHRHWEQTPVTYGGVNYD